MNIHIPETSTLKWAKYKYEYEKASIDHGCGYFIEEEEKEDKRWREDDYDYDGECEGAATLDQYNRYAEEREVEEKLTSLPSPSLATNAAS